MREVVGWESKCQFTVVRDQKILIMWSISCLKKADFRTSPSCPDNENSFTYAADEIQGSNNSRPIVSSMIYAREFTTMSPGQVFIRLSNNTKYNLLFERTNVGFYSNYSAREPATNSTQNMPYKKIKIGLKSKDPESKPNWIMTEFNYMAD